jgi:hypothetical protein
MKADSSSAEFKAVFGRLRAILERNSSGLTVSPNTATHYGLVGPVGPATLRAWGGKKKSETIMVAWLHLGKAYVSYHLMALYGEPKLGEGMSAALRKRRQGKTCLNFKTVDETLFSELEDLTTRCCEGMKRRGFVL